MRIFATCLALLLSGVAAGGPPMPGIKVSVDGLSKISPLHGRANWSGDLTVEGPGFTVTGPGSAQMFGGPRVVRKSSDEVPFRSAEFATEVEWISLIVTGDLKVVIVESGSTLDAARVVYVPEGARLLIDGKETALKEPVQTKEN